MSMNEKFEKDMAVFHLGQHQDALTYFDHLKRSGWTIEDARKWVKTKLEELTKTTVWKIAAKCPDCQSPMQLLRVNISPATRTNDNSKSVWLCTNKTCMNTIYSTESIEEILMKGKNKERKNVTP
jgi:hypothetical protein